MCTDKTLLYIAWNFNTVLLYVWSVSVSYTHLDVYKRQPTYTVHLATTHTIGFTTYLFTNLIHYLVSYYISMSKSAKSKSLKQMCIRDRNKLIPEQIQINTKHDTIFKALNIENTQNTKTDTTTTHNNTTLKDQRPTNQKPTHKYCTRSKTVSYTHLIILSLSSCI